MPFSHTVSFGPSFSTTRVAISTRGKISHSGGVYAARTAITDGFPPFPHQPLPRTSALREITAMIRPDVTPDAPVEGQPAIGFIGMGAMGNLYAKQLSAAGWKK